MGEHLGGLKRSCYCAEPTLADCGKELTLMGWVQRRRDLGSLIFVWLRDRTGVMQAVFNQSTLPAEVFEKAEAIRSEYVLAVTGTLCRRTDDAINPELKTGAVELIASRLKILSTSETPPFAIDDDTKTAENLRLKYRYLDLRRPSMQQNLMLRHKLAKAARDYFDDNGFMEIETPVLGRSTPEGARDYLVPSRVYPGRFFALPQSPQQFKQLLMVSGCDRYFQIARCFRDEDLRADRQPEFTQIDVEMSFIEQDDIMSVAEGLIKKIFSRTLGVDVTLPLRRMTYREAMERFGSDKPDLRFGMEQIDITDIAGTGEFKVFNDVVASGGTVRALNLKNSADKLPRKTIDALVEYVKTYRAKGLAWANILEGGVKSSIAKFFTPEQLSAIVARCGGEINDTLFFISDANVATAQVALGELRLELARRFDLIDKSKWELLWITEFPLLEYSEEENRYVAMHHPFTCPMDEDIDMLESDPGRVRAKAYDIVLNGNEIGGGSIRIHDSVLQQRMFNALGFTDEQAMARFGYLINAFKFGPPPHGGIAFGLDRLAMLIAGASSIRDVIAFPKTQNASCLMTDAPGDVDRIQLDDLSLLIAPKKEEK